MRSTRSQLASLLLSLAAHAGLIGLAAGVVYTTVEPRVLVPVSLLPGGGGVPKAAPPGAGAPAAEDSVQRPAPVPPRPRVLAAPRPERPRPPRRQRARPAEAPAAPAAASDAGAATSAPSAAAGEGASASAGQGGGSGSGSGSGGGVGAGNGPGRDLDLRLYCVSCPEPSYPRLARARGWQGATDVELTVLADGQVEAVNLSRSSGFDVLDRAALEVARKSRFTPPPPALAPPVRGRLAYRFELRAK